VVLLATIAAVGIGAESVFTEHGVHGLPAFLITYTFVPYTIFFGAGIVWSRYWTTVPKSRVLALLSIAAYAMVRTFNVLHVDADGGTALFVKGSISPLFALCWVLPLSYAALWVGHYGPRLLNAITTRIGDLSYGVYIWHMVVVNAVIYVGLPARSQRLTPIVVVVATFATAMMSWHLVEKRALRWKPYTSRPADLSASDTG
jgi:peptidoglycan/LPS O-acetylase OafA/YrhL